MKTVGIILVALILSPMKIFGQGYDRQPAVSGSFYPAAVGTLRNELAACFAKAGAPRPGVRVRALIVPHAGYVFSGRTAAAGFAAVPSGAVYNNIFLIGVSHRYAFEGAAVFTSGDMVTPLGKIKVNREAGEKLRATNRWFIEHDDAHGPEHSLEVELPFIQYHFDHQPAVVPILIGTRNTTVLKAVARGLQPWFNDRNLFVISSDFSHYPSYDDARRVDRLTGEAIIKGDPYNFLKTVKAIESSGTDNLVTAMCGWPAGLVLLYLTEGQAELSYRKAGYTNSGDSPHGSRDEVVGYNAIVVEKKSVASEKPSGSGEKFLLTAGEKSTLLAIARDAISARLHGRSPDAVDPSKITPRLREPLGAFVTITKRGELRGCIGRFTSSEPLWEVIGQMAVEAAFGDPRFPALTAAEYPLTELEISVLGPMSKVRRADEIKIGTHGIYLKHGMRTGTLLPQVASERGWNAEQFLGYCARDKAGIGWDGWKDKNCEIFVYEAYVFGEKGDK
jgi:hypothetical protein